MKLFALYLFNDIKIKSVESEESENVDENQNKEENEYDNAYEILEFDTKVSFYRETFKLLKKKELGEILPSNNNQVLWPLDSQKYKFKNFGIKLYYTSIEGEAEINIVDRLDKKTFYIKTKRNETFGHNRKNPTLRGDFGVFIKIKNKTYSCWLNSKIAQVAHFTYP